MHFNNVLFSFGRYRDKHYKPCCWVHCNIPWFLDPLPYQHTTMGTIHVGDFNKAHLRICPVQLPIYPVDGQPRGAINTGPNHSLEKNEFLSIISLASISTFPTSFFYPFYNKFHHLGHSKFVACKSLPMRHPYMSVLFRVKARMCFNSLPHDPYFYRHLQRGLFPQCFLPFPMQISIFSIPFVVCKCFQFGLV